ncbi:MAG: ComEC/Rec2 family competence protein [Oscillospiraceae bacterium]|nr:ComEC/Rec2 family competence protein [Oscillospiraceae bacterium]
MRYLVRFALPFCVSLLLGCLSPVWWLAFPAGAVCALAALLSVRRKGGRLAALSLLGAVLGFLWCGVYTMAVAIPCADYAGKEIGLTAVVTTYPAQNDYGCVVTARITEGEPAGRRVALYLDGAYSDLKPGDTLSGTARLSLPGRSAVSPIRFDAGRGVFLRASLQVERRINCAAVPVSARPAWLGARLREAIAALYPEQEGALLSALLTGDRGGMDDARYHSFSRSGMAHLLAVSGLHVGFLTSGLFLLPVNPRRRGIVALPVLVCFALMTGGAPSVWRSVLMASLLLLAPLFGREADPITSLTFALFLLVLPNPKAIRGVGLQLSFASMAGLALIQPRLYRRMTAPLERRPDLPLPIRAVFRFLWGSLSTSLVAMAFTLPLTAVHFGLISLAAPLTNLISLWLTALAFGLGLLSCLLWWWFPPLGTVAAQVNTLPLDALLWMARTVGNWRFSALPVDSVFLWLWLGVLFVVLVLILLSARVRRRIWIPLSVTALTLILAVALRWSSIASVPLAVTVLDVGQGSCTALTSDGVSAAVDCGGEDAGDVLADYLLASGARELSLLVLTHFDSDHVNGVTTLLSRMRVERLVIPAGEDLTGNRAALLQAAARAGTRIDILSEETTVSFGASEMTLFPPLSDASSNASGLCALIGWQGHHVLITGDLPQAQEEQLLEKYPIPRLDALVVGHHGARDAAGERLLTHCRPDFGVISVGVNHYGLPAQETLSRLDHYQVTVCRTDEDGNVTLRFR